MKNTFCLLSIVILSSCSLFNGTGDNVVTEVHHPAVVNKPKENASEIISEKKANAIQQDAAEGLISSISAWRKDWESMDVERYLLNYSAAFHNGIYDYKQWGSRKKNIIDAKNYIRVGMEDIKVHLSNSGLVARVTFWQDFLSDNYFDQSRKLLYWMKDRQNRWHIISEREVSEKLYRKSQNNSLSKTMVPGFVVSKYSIGHCIHREDCEQRFRDNCLNNNTKKTCLIHQ